MYILLSLDSAHILHLILETDLYLYWHNDCSLQDFNAPQTICRSDLEKIWEMLCEYILNKIIDPNGNFCNGAAHVSSL